jgi:RNA polymerase sigma factor (sigma-70 family)
VTGSADEPVAGELSEAGEPVAGEGAAAAFRPLLFSIAYGMTGSVGDSEDIVQDAFLGLTRARQAGTVIADQKAYLTTAVTRLGINYLRSARVRRETYVGDWLPEPVVVPAGAPGPAEHAELADSLSMAFLVLLEALSPVERAVFMLREVFGYDYPAVAAVTGKSTVNCRQIFARARQRIAAGQPEPSAGPAPAQRAEGEELARRFFAAAAGGDLDALLAMLAPDVVFQGDGGGKAQAIGQPLAGRDRVLRLIAGLFRRGQSIGASVRPAWVNGRPGGVTYDAGGRVINVFALDVDGGVVRAIRSVVNPDKLGHLGPVSDVARLGGRKAAGAGELPGDGRRRLSSGHGTPRRLPDVDVRALARPVPAQVAAAARPARRLRQLVQRRRGQHDLLRDPGAGHREVVGGPGRPRLPVHPQAAPGGHARAAAD